MDPSWIVDGPSHARHSFAFAHGAGAPMDSPFMNDLAASLAAGGVRVVRFEFPYMARMRETGKKRAPDRAPVLERTFESVVQALGAPERLFIGGKSMGGRIASMVAGRVGVAGVIGFGYPFHPPGKPDRLRIDHFASMGLPCLIVQGTRDNLGAREEVGGYDLPAHVTLHWMADGDHSLKPRKKSGFTQEAHLRAAADAALRFIAEHG